MEALAAYLHQLSILALAALLAAEFCLCHDEIQPGHVRLLARIDAAFLATAVLVFFTGAARMLGNGVWQHLTQPLFWLKMALFFTLGFLSILPTLQFMRWSRALALGQERVLGRPELRRARRVIGIELALLALIPLLAVLAGRGQATH